MSKVCLDSDVLKKFWPKFETLSVNCRKNEVLPILAYQVLLGVQKHFCGSLCGAGETPALCFAHCSALLVLHVRIPGTSVPELNFRIIYLGCWTRQWCKYAGLWPGQTVQGTVTLIMHQTKQLGHSIDELLIGVSIRKSVLQAIIRIPICTQGFDMLSWFLTKHDSWHCMLHSHLVTVVGRTHSQWFEVEKGAGWCWTAKLVEKSVKSRVFAKIKPWYNESGLLRFVRL